MYMSNVGAQLREWLLYFSLPVLKVILPALQLDHYCYLVAGIHIVLSDPFLLLTCHMQIGAFANFTPSLLTYMVIITMNVKLLFLLHIQYSQKFCLEKLFLFIP